MGKVEQETIWAEIVEEVRDQYEEKSSLETANAPELERPRFQIFVDIQKKIFLIERCRKTRMSILSRLEAMKAVSSSLHRAAEIEDIEFTEAAE